MLLFRIACAPRKAVINAGPLKISFLEKRKPLKFAEFL